jgi:DNA-binding CsgD family transcriptional regulator
MSGAASFGQQMVQEWDKLKEAEALRKRRIEANRARAEIALRAAATPETINKARACVMQRMFDNGQMTGEQLQAANEIAAVFTSLTRTLFAATSKYGAALGATGNDIPAGLRIAYVEHYIPWRDDQSRIVVGRQKDRCELVFMMAVDNYGPRQVADFLRMDQRTVKNHICESLYRYAEIAGWVEAKKVPVPLVPEAVFLSA